MFFKRYSINDIIVNAFKDESKICIDLRRSAYNFLIKQDFSRECSEHIVFMSCIRCNGGEYDIYYIKDEQLASLLYEYIFITSKTIPEAFEGIGLAWYEKNIRLLKRKKENKISYIISRRSFDDDISSPLTYYSQLNINLSLEKISLDFSNLFTKLGEFYNYNLAIISSLRPYEHKLDENDIFAVIDFLRSKDTYLDKILSGPLSNLFDRGVLSIDINKAHINRDLFMNALIFTKYPNVFENLESFFTIKYSNIMSYGNAIIDVEVFKETIIYRSETEVFEIYEDVHNMQFNVYKIKSSDDVEYLRDNDKWLEYFNVRLLSTLADDEHYLVVDDKSFRPETLKTFTENFVRKNPCSLEQRISDFVNILSREKFNWLRNLYIDENTNVLELLTYEQHGVSYQDKLGVNIDEIGKISFKPLPEFIKVSITQVLLSFIDYYRELSGYSVDELSKQRFIKMFPYLFAQNLISACTTKKYHNIDMDSELENLIEPNLIDKIEFMENIQDDNTISRTYLFDKFKASELGQKIKGRKPTSCCWANSSVEPSSFGLGKLGTKSVKEYITMLSNVDIKIAYLFFIPEKIIISNQFVSNNEYEIIGVIWNKDKPLYSLLQLIQGNLIDTKQLYRIIVQLLCHYKFHCNYEKLENVFVDLNCGITLFNAKFPEYTKISRTGMEKLYNRIIDEIKEKCGENSTNFDFFDYNDIINSDNIKYNGENSFYDILHSLLKIVGNLSLCEEHKHWHLGGRLCSECSKIYSVVEGGIVTPAIYEDEVAKTYKVKELVTSYLKILSESDLTLIVFGSKPRTFSAEILSELGDNFIVIWYNCYGVEERNEAWKSYTI